MAQPPLSQSVQRLERELGTKLFDRDNRRVALTAAGRVLLPQTRALLLQADQLLDSIRTARRGGVGGLRVAVVPGLEAERVAALLLAFGVAAPDVPLDLCELTEPEQRAALRAGHLDVAVLRGPVVDPALTVGPPVRETLGVLVAATSALARPASLHLSDLHEAPLAQPDPSDETAARQLLDRCLRGGYRPARVQHGLGPGVARALVLAGRAIALTPRARAPEVSPGMRWVPLIGEPLFRDLVPVWRATLDPALTGAFCRSLRQAVLQQEGGADDEGPAWPSGPPTADRSS